MFKNSNRTLSSAIFNLVFEKKVGIVFSMHSIIQRQLKGRTINVQADYEYLYKLARKTLKPFKVTYLDQISPKLIL